MKIRNIATILTGVTDSWRNRIASSMVRTVLKLSTGVSLLTSPRLSALSCGNPYEYGMPGVRQRKEHSAHAGEQLKLSVEGVPIAASI